MEDIGEYLIKIVIAFLITALLTWLGCSKSGARFCGRVGADIIVDGYKSYKNSGTNSQQNPQLYLYNNTRGSYTVAISCDQGANYYNYPIEVSQMRSFSCDNGAKTLFVNIGNGTTYICYVGNRYQVSYDARLGKYTLLGY